MPVYFHPQRRRFSLAWIALLLLLSRPAPTQQAGVPAQSVPLLLPSALAYDALGNLYLSETQRHMIRKVDTLGKITSVAGDSTQGFAGDGGPAVVAELNAPQGLAVDSSGNVFIADTGNNRIRRVDAATGSIATIAGSGLTGFGGDGGQATAASIDLPRAICLDSQGKNLYIADTRNHRIRRVDLLTGIIVTVAGDGRQGFSGDGALATAASLDSPDSMALNPSGDLYIADTRNQRVRQVAAGTGMITTVLGSGARVAGQQAAGSALALPRGLIADAQGNLYIAEAGNHRLLRMDAKTGSVSVVAGSSTQGFSGDGAPAISASLDSPRAVAFSPNGLVTIADSGNQRVRQLMTTPAPDTPLQTIAGLGATIPGVFSLSAPAVVAYGSGTATAAFRSNTDASGEATFVEVGDGSTVVIGTGAFVGNSATISLVGLAAGQHRIMATYTGDTTHAAAQTATALLTVTPLALKVTPTPVTMIYGAQLPVLSGSVDGLLPQDAGRLAVSFTSSATSSTPVGAYAITAVLTGSASANYTLQTESADLVISQAASSLLLQNGSPDGSFTGTLLAQVNSSTSGIPSGAVVLVDNGVTLQQASLDRSGLATFTQIVLPAGTHSLTAGYPGDGNFLPSSSAVLAETIAPTAAGDFTLTATGSTSQLLVAGNSVSYPLTVQMTSGGMSSPIALSISGLPPFTNASFNPGYVPPASRGAATVTLTISSLSSFSHASAKRRLGGYGYCSGALYAYLWAVSAPFPSLDRSCRGSLLRRHPDRVWRSRQYSRPNRQRTPELHAHCHRHGNRQQGFAGTAQHDRDSQNERHAIATVRETARASAAQGIWRHPQKRPAPCGYPARGSLQAPDRRRPRRSSHPQPRAAPDAPAPARR